MACRNRHPARPLDRSLAPWLLAVMAGLTVLAIGCSPSRLVIELDESAATGFGGRVPTWDWAPAPGPEGEPWFEGPDATTPDVHPRLRALIADALGTNGLLHTNSGPDLHVRYQLTVRRMRVVSYERRPPRRITGSLIRGHYEVHSVLRIEREYDEMTLEIHVARAVDARPVWVARLRERLPDSFEPHLAEAVARLFEEFPPAPSTTAALRERFPGT